MTIYIWFKIFINKLLRNISPLKDEIAFVKDNFSHYKYIWQGFLEKGLSYKQDLLFGKQFDWQYSSDILFKKGGGDCNSIHRLFQMYFWLKNYDSYLVTIITDNIKKNHTTCICKKDNYYYLFDYDLQFYGTFIECIEELKKRHNIKKVLSITCQDINWKIKRSI